MRSIDTSLFEPDEFAIYLETNAPIDLGRMMRLLSQIEKVSKQGPVPATGLEVLQLKSGSLFARLRPNYGVKSLSTAQEKRIRKRYDQLMAEAGSAVREDSPQNEANRLTAQGNSEAAKQTRLMIAALAVSIVVPMISDRPSDLRDTIADMMKNDGVTCVQVVTASQKFAVERCDVPAYQDREVAEAINGLTEAIKDNIAVREQWTEALQRRVQEALPPAEEWVRRLSERPSAAERQERDPSLPPGTAYGGILTGIVRPKSGDVYIFEADAGEGEGEQSYILVPPPDLAVTDNLRYEILGQVYRHGDNLPIFVAGSMRPVYNIE